MLLYPRTPGLVNGPPVGVGTAEVVVEELGSATADPFNVNSEMKLPPALEPIPLPPQIWLMSPIHAKLQFPSST